MKKGLIALALVVIVAAGVWWSSLDKGARAVIAEMPTDGNVLFWSVEQRDAGFRALDSLPALAQSRVIEAGDSVYPLPVGERLDIAMSPAQFMQDQRSAALVIVHDGEVVFEEYGLDFSADGKWTSFSVAKSLTSTMVGAALRDGAIESLDDPVTKYISGLEGSAYDDVSVEQLLTMTSGVQWNEDYSDPNSDVALFNNHEAEDGLDVTVSYMRNLPREAPAGEKWVYKTGETNLIGVLVSEATGKPLAEYLSEKVWTPFGMEQDATWLLGSTDQEIGGCCIQASTRDMARFGLFILGGGIAGGIEVLPEGWLEAATTKQADTGVQGEAYGYQWWTNDNGTFAAQGIFGQGIFIDRERGLVIASNSNWPKATDPEYQSQRDAFYRSVQDAIDAKVGAAGAAAALAD